MKIALIFLLLATKASEGFGFTIPSKATTSTASSPSSSVLFNVPPKSTSDTDPASLKDAANREPPPQSFYQLGVNSVRAAELAILDGNKLIEIEVSGYNSSIMVGRRMLGGTCLVLSMFRFIYEESMEILCYHLELSFGRNVVFLMM